MKKALLKALNIEPGEGFSVALMMAQSFFIGAFIITFQISTNSLFLKEVGGEELGKAYLISGMLGITLTSIYSFFQNRMKFSVLALFTYILVGAAAIGIWVGFDMNFVSRKELVYIAFLAIGPFIALVAYITFWGVMGRIYSLRQGKRLFGLIDSGQILAMILMSFAIPFISKVMPDTKDLMLIGSSSLILALLMQFVISIRFRKQLGSSVEKGEDGKKKKNKEASVSRYIKNPYIRMLAMFVFLSMLAQFFVEYSFMKAANGQYPDERDLTSFFGFFMGTLLIFSFIFKVFVYGRLIQMYGLKVNLLILPIILVFFTLLASIVGSFLGYSPESESYMYFFMFIITSKLFAQSLRVSIEVPAFKILYQPLDKGIRFDVQARIDGFVNELSATLGGAILWSLQLVGFQLIHFSWILIPIIGGWMYLTIRLYDKYQSTLRESLTKLKTNATEAMDKLKEADLKGMLYGLVDKGMNNLSLYCMQAAKQISPILFESVVKTAIKSSNKNTRLLGWKEIERNQIFLSEYNLSEELKSETDEECKTVLANILNYKSELEEKVLDQMATIKMLRSKYRQERIKLAKLLSMDKNKSVSNFLHDLLKDVDFMVRREAIRSVVVSRNEEHYLSMIENMSVPELRNTVSYGILELGEEILEDLDTAFYKSGFSSDTLCTVVDLIGEINGKRSTEMLVAKLTYPDLKVVDQSFVSLRKCNFQATGEEKNKITQAIEAIIGVMMWNIAAMLEIENYDFDQTLEKAFKHEIEGNQELLFMMLSTIYDPKTIKHIKENIESGTAEGIGFAIELLDIVVDDALKPKLFPILDDLKPEDRIRALQPFYPRFELSREESLRAMMNRSFSEIKRWTKAAAIWNYSKLRDAKVCNDLIAQLFNPDVLLQQTAAWVLKTIDVQKYNEVLRRLDEEVKDKLVEDFELIEKGEDELLYKKILLVNGIEQFSSLNGDEVADLFRNNRTVHSLSGENIGFESENELKIVWKGVIEEDGKEIKQNMAIDGLTRSKTDVYKVKEDSIIFEMHNVFDVVTKSTDVAKAILNFSGEMQEENYMNKQSA